MKRGLVIGALVAACAVAWFVLSPILAVRGLGEAIEQADAEALEERVDFPSVRQGMKDQINAEMLRRSGIDAADNPLGAFAIGIASKLADGMVDAFVTPSGLALLSRGRQPLLPPRGASADEPQPRHPAPDAVAPDADDEVDETGDAASSRPFADARIERESFDRFAMHVPDDRGGELRFAFRRHGLGWKLERVELPLSRDEAPPTP